MIIISMTFILTISVNSQIMYALLNISQKDGSLGWIKIEAKNKPPQTRGWQTCTPYKSGFVIWGGAHWDIIFNDIFFLHFGLFLSENFFSTFLK